MTEEKQGLCRHLFSAVSSLILYAGLLLPSQVYAETVAVIDSGVNPGYADLVGRIVPGVDLIDGDDNPFDEMPLQHGTTVSRIIASVNEQNKIMPIRVLDSSGLSSEALVIAGVTVASNSDSKVINLSLGSLTNFYSQALTASMQSSAWAGKLFVIAAGNGGQPNPTFPASLAALFGGSAIAVGALDRNGLIASYSNRAGNSQQFYVVAPGYSSFSNFIGTSFAAPYVSGTAAAILTQNPGLSAQQIAEIIFNSADDLGVPGTDTVYGRGRLNTAAALQPQGDLSIPGTSSDSGGSSALVAGLVVGAGVAAAIIIRNKSLKKAVVVDSYNRPYQIDLTDLITVHSEGLSLERMIQNLRRTTEMARLAVTDRLQMAIWYDRNPAQRLYAVPELEDKENIENWSMSLYQRGQNGAYYALNLNLDPRQFFGLAEETSGITLFDRRNLTAPYAGFAASANMALAGYKTKSGIDVKLGVVSMDDKRDFGVKSKSVLLEGSIQPHEKLRLGLQFSGLNEQGSLFGGASAGAFSVDTSETLAVGVTARLKLNRKISIHSIYSQGFTLVNDRKKGLLQQFTGIRSSSYAMGISATGLIRKNDRVSLTLSSPLHVNRGEVSLSVPTGIDFVSGNTLRQTERIDLGSTKRETDIELGYHLPLGKQSGLAAYMIYRTDPNGLNEQVARGRYGTMVNFSSRF
ncbi:MAG: S8 family serine peptidase [Gammaproteobacteria bacterium]|nr:S8 family serine peptidase [Gammaproteobacteria bacterium]